MAQSYVGTGSKPAKISGFTGKLLNVSRSVGALARKIEARSESGDAVNTEAYSLSAGDIAKFADTKELAKNLFHLPALGGPDQHNGMYNAKQIKVASVARDATFATLQSMVENQKDPAKAKTPERALLDQDLKSLTAAFASDAASELYKVHMPDYGFGAFDALVSLNKTTGEIRAFSSWAAP